MAKLNPGHYLLGCRLDNWLKLLWQNRFRVRKGRRLQALAITLVSLVMFPFALLEALIFFIPLRRQLRRSPADPVYIIGHWRSGTTFLQNLMAQDPQFGWCDPVSTASVSNCLLLGKLVRPYEKMALKGARPMDNMKYNVDLPIEDTFGVATISTLSIIHMIAFPENFQRYFGTAFVDELPPWEQRKWRQATLFLLRRVSWLHKGRQLLLKSPDNTCHIPQILSLFPDSRFINIHRDPYTTVMSTINMFKKQMEILDLGYLPPGDIDLLLENSILQIFEKMYRALFQQEDSFRPNRYVDICYEDFEKDPLGGLERIYQELELKGFNDALPHIKKYLDSQKNYQKNSFKLKKRLCEKINSQLAFYFERYGYPMLDPEECE